MARSRIERSFLSASCILIPLNFLVSDLIDAVSSSSYRLCCCMFLSFHAFFGFSIRFLSDFPELVDGEDVFPKDLVGSSRCLLLFFAMIVYWKRSLQSSHAMGGSTVRFCQIGGFHLTLDSLFDS